MRGKDDLRNGRFQRQGITPAYAGKRALVAVLVTMPKDHPRLCGEKGDVDLEWVEKTGSPPPMRGKASDLDLGIVMSGITPAYAGKSVRQLRTCGSGQDHPRLCGEKSASKKST